MSSYSEYNPDKAAFGINLFQGRSIRPKILLHFLYIKGDKSNKCSP